MKIFITSLFLILGFSIYANEADISKKVKAIKKGTSLDSKMKVIEEIIEMDFLTSIKNLLELHMAF